MTPYYEEPGITIYHGDCRDVLPSFPQQSVHLILTDPPYGQQWVSNMRRPGHLFGPIVGDNGDGCIVECLQATLKILQPHRHIYVFGSWDLSLLPLGGLIELIWDKEYLSLGDLSLPWAISHEKIMFGVYVGSRQNRMNGQGNGAARLRRSSVLRCPRPNGVAITRHPTEKPVLLLRELIESSSRIGEVILDPFMGSGSAVVAARIAARQAIGIEIEERYCEIAVNRLRQGILPLAMGE